jgi:hypothetical protein
LRAVLEGSHGAVPVYAMVRTAYTANLSPFGPRTWMRRWRNVAIA